MEHLIEHRHFKGNVVDDYVVDWSGNDIEQH
jgi:hypothetical protein